jgi:sigma-E factor negative regulatory protein RseC
MIAHAGQVRRIDGARALVAVATSGCSSCGHLGGCGIGKLAGRRRETLIALPALPGLSAGDAVTLELDEAQVTRAALLGYLLPAVCLIAGALLGEKVGAGGTAADSLAALGAVAGLLTGLSLTRLRRPLTPRLSRSIFVSPLENPHV